ncbi:Conjugal transfer, TraB [mine drainage metagenome]|uniref:Conjugal transfer, TraB n=1 Tax=mine drainage metagenome TaxID=410659 RepID=T1AHV7_9ZZZZ
MVAFWRLPDGHTSGIHPPLDNAAYGKTHIAALICYEQALVWPVLWTLTRHHPTLIVAPESVHWEKSAALGNLEARLARAWGRLYGLPVALAVNLPKTRALAESDPDFEGMYPSGRV